MKNQALLLTCFLVMGVCFTGCMSTEKTVSETAVNSTITLTPGDQRTYQLPWLGTYTHIRIRSDIPVKITRSTNSPQDAITTSNFNLDKKLGPDQTITIENSNAQPATVNVEIAAVKEYKTLI